VIYLKVVLLITCIVAGILFGISNQFQAVLSLFGFATKPVPLYLMLLAAFLAGAVLAFVYNMLGGSDTQSSITLGQERIREMEKLVKEQQSQIDTLRATKAKHEQERKLASQPTPELAEKV
jgi:hypothetical protein